MDCRQLYGYKRPQLYPTAPCTYLPVKLFFCKYHLSEPMDSCVGMSLNIHSPIPSEELKHAFCISSFSEYAHVDPNTLSVMEQNEQTNKQTNSVMDRFLKVHLKRPWSQVDTQVMTSILRKHMHGRPQNKMQGGGAMLS